MGYRTGEPEIEWDEEAPLKWPTLVPAETPKELPEAVPEVVPEPELVPV
jgi:hypothetical protein